MPLSRSLLAGMLLLVLAPALAQMAGMPSAAGTAELVGLWTALDLALRPIAGTELNYLPAVWLWLPLALAGAAFWLERNEKTQAATGLAAVAVVLGAVPAAWLVVGAAATDPAVWGGGVVVAALLGVGADEGAGRGRASWVFVGLALWLGLSVVGETGSTPGSPLFALGEVWLAGPGQVPWLSGALFWLPAVALGVRALRVERRAGPPVPLRETALFVVIAAVVWAAKVKGGGHLAVAGAVSALGLLIAVGIEAWGRKLGVVALLLWSAVCVGRGIAVGMWTAPGALPPGVERLAGAEDPFGLAVGDGVVLWTERAPNRIRMVGPEGEREVARRAAGEGAAGDEVEAAFFAGGRFWVTVWTAENRGGLLPVEVDGTAGALLDIGDCNATSWTPITEELARSLGTRPGDVVVGCEGVGSQWRLDPVGVRVTALPPWVGGREHLVVSGDGTRSWDVILWGGTSLLERAFPGGAVTRELPVGPLNFAMTQVGEELALGRFVEGAVRFVDPRAMEATRTVELSMGVRALAADGERLWASAATSGRLWLVEGEETRAWGLCGQGRGLAVDDQGRALVGTSCGIFRVSPEAEEMP